MMTTEEFILRLLRVLALYVAALAWPICIFLVFRLFKDQIRGLLSQIKNVSWQGLEASFGDRVVKLESKLSKATRDKINSSNKKSALPLLSDTQRETIQQLALTSPRAAIVEAWLYVEASVFDLLKRKGLLPEQRRVSLREGFALLAKHEVISRELHEFAISAQQLRNEAAHSLDFNYEPSTVDVFLSLINSLSEILSAAD